MTKRLLYWINSLLIVVITLLVVATIVFAWSRPGEIPLPLDARKKTELPKRSFVFSKPAYDAIASSALQLKFSPPRHAIA